MLQPRNVILGMIAAVCLLGFFEQQRIGARATVPTKVTRTADGSETPTELPARLHVTSKDTALKLAIDNPTGRRRRVRMRIFADRFASGTLRVALKSSGPDIVQYVTAESLAKQAGDQEPTFDWEQTYVIPAGAASVEISGSEGLDVVVHEAGFRSIKTTLTGPNFQARLPWIAGLLVAAWPVYWLLHRRKALSQWFLVGVSLAVLMLIEIAFAGAIFAFVTLVYAMKHRFLQEGNHRRLLLTSVLLACCGVLGLFKYAPHWFYGYFVTIGVGAVCFPIGVSYFMFRIVDVVLEWYRGNLAELSYREYLCYFLFFPVIPAGPIETASQFHANRQTGLSGSLVVEAAIRILLGLFKKLFIVAVFLQPVLFNPVNGLLDQVSLHADTVSLMTVIKCSLYCLLYAYFDLSAYSDLAIGVGLLFGYRVRENFNWPLLQTNIANFWRSYHVSLGEWCTRNVYYPALITTRRTGLAIFASFLVMGIWHHVNLDWIFWAAHHALGVVLIGMLGEFHFRYGQHERYLAWQQRLKWPSRLIWRPMAVGLTVMYAAMGTTFVFVEDFGTSLELYTRIWTLS